MSPQWNRTHGGRPSFLLVVPRQARIELHEVDQVIGVLCHRCSSSEVSRTRRASLGRAATREHQFGCFDRAPHQLTNCWRGDLQFGGVEAAGNPFAALAPRYAFTSATTNSSSQPAATVEAETEPTLQPPFDLIDDRADVDRRLVGDIDRLARWRPTNHLALHRMCGVAGLLPTGGTAPPRLPSPADEPLLTSVATQSWVLRDCDPPLLQRHRSSERQPACRGSAARSAARIVPSDEGVSGAGAALELRRALSRVSARWGRTGGADGTAAGWSEHPALAGETAEAPRLTVPLRPAGIEAACTEGQGIHRTLGASLPHVGGPDSAGDRRRAQPQTDVPSPQAGYRPATPASGGLGGLNGAEHSTRTSLGPRRRGPAGHQSGGADPCGERGVGRALGGATDGDPAFGALSSRRSVEACWVTACLSRRAPSPPCMVKAASATGGTRVAPACTPSRIREGPAGQPEHQNRMGRRCGDPVQRPNGQTQSGWP